MTFNLQDFLKKIAKNNIRYSLYVENNELLNHKNHLPETELKYINLDNSFSLRWYLNTDSSLLQRNNKILEKQIFWTNLFTLGLFILFTINFVIRKTNIIKLNKKIFDLETKLLNELNKNKDLLSFYEMNKSYIINCYNKSKELFIDYKLFSISSDFVSESEYLPLPLVTDLKVKHSNKYVIDLLPLIGKLKTYCEGYKILSNAKIA